MPKYPRNRLIYTLLLIACIIGFWIFDYIYTPATYSTPEGKEIKTQIPKEFLPVSTTNALVEHSHFSLSYNEKYEQAEWVAYVLKRSHLTNDKRKRPFFIEDPKVKTKSADWKNYRGSGYDRGHLCPAGDRRFSSYAYNETFYTSNISPQDKDFNAGIWNRLEMQIRAWAKRYGTLFVVTGGVLGNGLPTVGDEEVVVARYFYKIIARGQGKNIKLLAFLMPNYESRVTLQQTIVTVDSLEGLTGIDFFKIIPDDIEDALESGILAKNWKF